MPTTALSETGALPAGLNFTDNHDGTATISGTPAAATGGNYHLTLGASNGVSPDATQSFLLTVNQPQTIVSPGAATFTAGQASSFTVSTRGFPTGSLSLIGFPPTGVTFHDNGNGTATIAGTPGANTGGVYNLEVRASTGARLDARQTVFLTVNQVPVISTPAATNFAFGVQSTFIFQNTGFPRPTLNVVGSLPAGLSFTDNHNGTATLAGAPAAGIYTFTVAAHNATNATATQVFTLTVGKAPVVTSLASATFPPGVKSSFTFVTTGSPTAVLALAGTLPPGITFTNNGNGTAKLSGKATAKARGVYSLTFTASNGVGPATTQQFTLVVGKVSHKRPKNVAHAIKAALSTFIHGSEGTR